MKTASLRAQFFIKVLRKAKHGTVEVEFPDGKKEIFGEGQPYIRLTVKKWEVIDLLFKRGDLGLAETIVDADLEVDDVTALVEWACRNDQDLGQAIHGAWYGTILERLRRLMVSYDRENSKGHIMAHYDLGNEFYKLWLDPTMTYSSAIFQTPDQPLADAQFAKYDRIIESLNIKSGDHVLEIGCGWGGFFSRAVEKTGCKVTAVMNSPEQARFNTDKIRKSGYGTHVELLQQDYRDIKGQFDKVVSIEMIEAVGEKNWSTFFGKVGSSLKSNGSAMIQGITIREDLFYSYRKSTDFIQKYIFPGGMLLTNQVFADMSQKNGMGLSDTFHFALSYAETLKQWREKFHHASVEVKRMGFDDKFIRLWSLYLSYCEGAFRAGRINVGQFLMER